MNKHTPIEITTGATDTPVPTVDNWKVSQHTPDIEGIVEEFDHNFFDSEHYAGEKTGAKFCGCYEGDINDVFDCTRAEVLTWLRSALTLKDQAHKAEVEKEREETREILRCVSRIINASATNLENYIIGQMPTPLPGSDKQN